MTNVGISHCGSGRAPAPLGRIGAGIGKIPGVSYEVMFILHEKNLNLWKA